MNSNLVPVGAPIVQNNMVYKLDISKYITIIYKDITFSDGTIQNKVRAEIELDEIELIDTAEDNTSTAMEIPGKVIVKYVDEATGEELTKKTIQIIQAIQIKRKREILCKELYIQKQEI